MTHVPGVAVNFLDRFDTNTEEKHNLCLPLARPRGVPQSLGSLGCLLTAGTPQGLKKEVCT